MSCRTCSSFQIYKVRLWSSVRRLVCWHAFWTKNFVVGHVFKAWLDFLNSFGYFELVERVFLQDLIKDNCICSPWLVWKHAKILFTAFQDIWLIRQSVALGIIDGADAALVPLRSELHSFKKSPRIMPFYIMFNFMTLVKPPLVLKSSNPFWQVFLLAKKAWKAECISCYSSLIMGFFSSNQSWWLCFWKPVIALSKIFPVPEFQRKIVADCVLQLLWLDNSDVWHPVS